MLKSLSKTHDRRLECRVNKPLNTIKKNVIDLKGSIAMKKLIATCFAFLFLLAVVAGCPGGGKSGNGSSDSESAAPAGGSGAVDFDDSGSDTMTSSDESAEDLTL